MENRVEVINQVVVINRVVVTHIILTELSGNVFTVNQQITLHMFVLSVQTKKGEDKKKPT